MKLLVPAGFMPGTSAGTIMIELCTGAGPQTIAMALPATGDHDKQGDHGKGEMPCAFAGLSAPSLAAADPILIALAIAFIVATVFRSVPVVTAPGFAHLRPPLRGPPATI